MYFRNLKALKADLIAEKASDEMMWPYFLGASLLNAAESIGYVMEKGTPASYAEKMGAPLHVLLTFVGLWFCFKMNGGVKGKAFLNRYFSLSWVLGFRVLLWFVPVLIIVGLIFSPKDVDILKSWFDLIGLAFSAWIFWRTGRELAQLA